MEAHFGRDTETLERIGTDLSHLFCSPCVAKAPQGIFYEMGQRDNEVGQRGGTGKPTGGRRRRRGETHRGGTGNIEVGQASQLPRWDTSRWDIEVGHRGGTGKPTGGRRRRSWTGKPRSQFCRRDVPSSIGSLRVVSIGRRAGPRLLNRHGLVQLDFVHAGHRW